MKFFLDETHTIITCCPEGDSELIGFVGDQQYKMQNHSLWFDKRPSNSDLHPDLLGLICLLVFYPFIQNSSRIEFPKPVSRFFLEILKLHQINASINSDSNLISIQEKQYSNKVNNVALSWGGGLDSWACLKLQPELYSVLIHEEMPESPLPLNLDGYPNVHLVRNNQRSIAIDSSGRSGGWVNWASVLVSSIWLSQEYNLRMIALGGNLGSVFLKGGAQYFPSHLKPNLWFRTFKMIGLPLYLPLAGLTDLGVIKVLGDDLDKVRYCPFIDKVTGSNCHNCWKCIRKEILMGREVESLNPKWRDKFIGPSFKYVLNGGERLGSWVDRYYQPGFELIDKSFPSALEELLKKRLAICGVSLLDPKNEYLVEHFGWEI